MGVRTKYVPILNTCTDVYQSLSIYLSIYLQYLYAFIYTDLHKTHRYAQSAWKIIGTHSTVACWSSRSTPHFSGPSDPSMASDINPPTGHPKASCLAMSRSKLQPWSCWTAWRCVCATWRLPPDNLICAWNDVGNQLSLYGIH